MSQTLSETLGYERLRSGLSASAATVGRPAGVGGKRIPHRSKMTKKEIEKLNTKGMKAGGPGSGRRPGQGTLSIKDKLASPVHSKAHKELTKNGWRHLGTNSNGHSVYQGGRTKARIIVKPDGSQWMFDKERTSR